jgi:hypothetical protein
MGVLKERQESGRSIRAWCRENKVTEKTYYYWQRKLREVAANQATRESAGASQLPVPKGWAMCMPAKQEPKAATVSIEIGKFRVAVNADAGSDHLEKVCRVLMSLC